MGTPATPTSTTEMNMSMNMNTNTDMRMFVVEVGNSMFQSKVIPIRQLLQRSQPVDGNMDIDMDNIDMDTDMDMDKYEWMIDPRPIWYDRFMNLPWKFDFQILHGNDNDNDDTDTDNDSDNGPKVKVTRMDRQAGWNVVRFHNFLQRIMGSHNSNSNSNADSEAKAGAAKTGKSVRKSKPVPLRFRLYRIRISKEDPSSMESLQLQFKSQLQQSFLQNNVYTYMGQRYERPPHNVRIVFIHPSVTILPTDAFQICPSLHACICLSHSQSDTSTSASASDRSASNTSTSKLHTIEPMAFSHCHALRVIQLSPSVKYIGKEAFKHCVSLDAIYIPPTIQALDEGCFLDCNQVKVVALPESNENENGNGSRNGNGAEMKLLEDKKIGKRIIKDCTKLRRAMINRYNTDDDEGGEEDFIYDESDEEYSDVEEDYDDDANKENVNADGEDDAIASGSGSYGGGGISISLHPNVKNYLSDKCEKQWLRERYNEDEYPLHKLCYYSIFGDYDFDAVGGASGASTSADADGDAGVGVGAGTENGSYSPTYHSSGKKSKKKNKRRGKKSKRQLMENANANAAPPPPEPKLTIMQQAEVLIQSSTPYSNRRGYGTSGAGGAGAKSHYLTQRDDFGMTPLHILCIASSTHPETYQKLWNNNRKGSDDNEDNSNEYHDQRHIQLLQYIFEADPSAATVQDMDGKCPIHYAANNMAFPWGSASASSSAGTSAGGFGFQFLHQLASATKTVTVGSGSGTKSGTKSGSGTGTSSTSNNTITKVICAASIPDHDGKTALHYLASNPYVTPSAIGTLYHVHPAAAIHQDHDGCCPIHYAVTNERACIKGFIDILATAKVYDDETVGAGTGAGTGSELASPPPPPTDSTFTYSNNKHAAQIYNQRNETATAIAIPNVNVSLDICVYLYTLYPVLRSEIRHTGEMQVDRLEDVIDAYITQFDTGTKILHATKLEQEGYVRHMTNLYRRDDLPYLEKWITHVTDPIKYPIGQLKLIAAFRGSNGRMLGEYAPPRIKQAIAQRTAFLQRFKLTEAPPVHMSQKLLILKAIDLNGDEHYRDKYNEYVNGCSARDADAEYLRKRGLDSHQLNELVQRVFLGKVDYLDQYLDKFDLNKDEYMQCEEFVKFCKETFDEGQTRIVALKFMTDLGRFEKETEVRKEFDSNHDFLSVLVNIDASYTNISEDEFSKVLYAIGMDRDDVPASGYPYVHVMPCGDRNVETIYRLEQPNLNQVRGICQEIANNLNKIHDNGVCCGNLKMNNIVRFNGALKMTDLTTSVRKRVGNGSAGGNINSRNGREAKYYVGSSFTSGVLPPEMIHSLDAANNADPSKEYSEEEYNSYMAYFQDIRENDPKSWKKMEPKLGNGNDSPLVVKTFLTETRTITRHGRTSSFLAIRGTQQDLPYDPVLATEAIDLWSFGSIMFTLLTAKPLFDLDRSGRFKSFESMKELAMWTDHHKLKRLADVEDSAARDLLEKLLSRDPKDRGTFQQVLDHVFFKACGKAGALNADIVKTLETLKKNQMIQMESLKKIDTATREISQSIETSSQSIMKAVFEATEVNTPTCFILRPKEEEGEGEEELVAKTGNFIGKLMTSFDTITAVVKDPNLENVMNVADIFMEDQRREVFSLYLIDEYTGQTVDPPYEVTLNGQAVAEYLPVMANGWKAVSTLNSVAGFAKAFFPLIPTIPSETMDQMNNMMGVLGSDNDLMVEASKSGESSTVRGAKLRNFEKFLLETEEEQNLNFAGLRRVNDKSGNAIWVTEESYQAMQSNVPSPLTSSSSAAAGGGGSAAAAAPSSSSSSRDVEAELAQLKAEYEKKISEKDDEIQCLQGQLNEKEELLENGVVGGVIGGQTSMLGRQVEEVIMGDPVCNEEWGLGGCFITTWKAIAAPFVRNLKKKQLKIGKLKMPPAEELEQSLRQIV